MYRKILFLFCVFFINVSYADELRILSYNEHAPYPVKPDDSRYGSVINNVPIKSNFHTNDLNNIGYSDHFPIAVKLSW